MEKEAPTLAQEVEALEAEREAKRTEAIANLTAEQQVIVKAMDVAGFLYQPDVGYSGEPIVFYANTCLLYTS